MRALSILMKSLRIVVMKSKCMLMDMPEPYAEWQRGVTGQKESSHYLFAVGCGGTLVRPCGHR